MLGLTQVFLNVYDVPANGNESMTAIISKVNRIGRDLGMGLGCLHVVLGAHGCRHKPSHAPLLILPSGIGGVFHGAIQVFSSSQQSQQCLGIAMLAQLGIALWLLLHNVLQICLHDVLTRFAQLDNYEWSFGWCSRGTGVYVVEARRNPMYTFRETVALGPTAKSKQEVMGDCGNT
jgi:hypothetical protein